MKPFVEEAALQVSNWGFSLVDLKLQKRKYNRKNVLNWLKAIFTETQEYEGFLGPIHIWQVSASMLLKVHLHKSFSKYVSCIIIKRHFK